MKCVWCSGDLQRKGSRQIPYWYKNWRKGSMHAACFQEFDSIFTYDLPQATTPEGKYDYWITARKGDYKFTLSPVSDAFRWLETAEEMER